MKNIIVKAANDVVLVDIQGDGLEDAIINKNVEVYQDDDTIIIKLKSYIDNGGIKYED